MHNITIISSRFLEVLSAFLFLKQEL